MPGHVRVGGAWKEIAQPYVYVAGSWKQVTEGWTRVGGLWKQWFSSDDYVLIASANLTAAANVTFSSIPQTYRHLEVVISGQRNALGRTTDRFRVNNISTNSYYWSGGFASSGNTTIASSAGALSFQTIGYLNDTADTAKFSESRILINDYTSNKAKSFMVTSASTSASREAATFSGSLNTTAPINSIFMFVADTYAPGSKFYLYGIR
jgi:hypothetical protein